jgi:hypothetical protein
LNLIADHKITLIGDSGSSTDFIQLNSGDDYISLVDDIDNSKISISHKAYNAEILGTAEKTAVELAHKGSFSAITGVERDAGGHVVGVVSETWSLPEDQNTTYSLEGVVADIDNGVSVTSTLVGSDTSNDVAAFNLTSESLQIAKVDESNNIQVNLTWGSF